MKVTAEADPAQDAAVCGQDSEHSDDAGDREGGAVSPRCASGQLCRPGTAGTLERWAPGWRSSAEMVIIT
jgi:hypothetical protein